MNSHNASNQMHLNSRQLMKQAENAREYAHAPYSNYSVGAALQTKSGKVFIGCNVENASFGLTVCAERIAVYKAISEGETEFEAIAIANPGRSGNGPCGACRQVLREFCVDLIVYVRQEGDRITRLKLSDLLPKSFGPQLLSSSTSQNHE